MHSVNELMKFFIFEYLFLYTADDECYILSYLFFVFAI